MDMILSQVDMFEEAPFTIQRVCELLIEPGKHYTSTDKYMRALLKNLLVVSGTFFFNWKIDKSRISRYK